MRTLLVVSVLAMLVAACATSQLTPSASVTTLMPDSERWFRLSWEAVPERGSDQRRLRGYLENTYGEAAGHIRLLGQALDASGAVVGQKIWYVWGAAPGFGRIYYEIPHMPPADHYRVTVWTYERIQGRDGWGF